MSPVFNYGKQLTTKDIGVLVGRGEGEGNIVLFI